jgi:hypothetical protein
VDGGDEDLAVVVEQDSGDSVLLLLLDADCSGGQPTATVT